MSRGFIPIWSLVAHVSDQSESDKFRRGVARLRSSCGSLIHNWNHPSSLVTPRAWSCPEALHQRSTSNQSHSTADVTVYLRSWVSESAQRGSGCKCTSWTADTWSFQQANAYIWSFLHFISTNSKLLCVKIGVTLVGSLYLDASPLSICPSSENSSNLDHCWKIVWCKHRIGCK